ncbi:MAG: hypothetical protein M1119_12410 [Firmicutes bacterium]|nr:hypothetical protein [Bacillota bacterium]
MALQFEEILSPLPKGGLEGEIKVWIWVQVHEDPDDGGFYAVTSQSPLRFWKCRSAPWVGRARIQLSF